MPVFGRETLAAICLRQLGRVCDAAPVEATAVVIGDDPATLDVARDIGFATVRRDNEQLGRKFNDGFQLACDPAYNPEPADYAIPCGSDNLLASSIIDRLPPHDRIGIFRQQVVVSEDRANLARLRVGYKYGTGIRVIPAAMLSRCGYRPAAEDRGIGLDSSITEGLKHGTGKAPAHLELDRDELQIVGLKTAGQQLHTFRELQLYRRGETVPPWPVLQERFPEAVAELIASGA